MFILILGDKYTLNSELKSNSLYPPKLDFVPNIETNKLSNKITHTTEITAA